MFDTTNTAPSAKSDKHLLKQRFTLFSSLFLAILMSIGNARADVTHEECTSSTTVHCVSNEEKLRSALSSADAGDTIMFTADITLTADFGSVNKEITIDGNNYSFNFNGKKVFKVESAGNLHLINVGSATIDPVTSAVTINGSLNRATPLADNESANGHLSIENSVFYNNTNASVVSVRKGNGVIDYIKDSFFIANGNMTADLQGGAVRKEDNNTRLYRIENTQFIGNVANKQGGAVNIEGLGSTDITNSLFRYNYSKGMNNRAEKGDGGAILFGGDTITGVSGSTFDQNYAKWGGAVYKSMYDNKQPAVYFIDSDFTHNGATNSYGVGGAIFNASGALYIVADQENVLFDENKAGATVSYTDPNDRTSITMTGGTPNDIHNVGSLYLLPKEGHTLTLNGGVSDGLEINGSNQINVIANRGVTYIGGQWDNRGTLEDHRGTVYMNGELTQKDLNVIDGNLVVNADNIHITDNTISNSGTITFTGGANTHEITGYTDTSSTYHTGTVVIDGDVTNSSKLTLSNLKVNADKSLTNSADINISDTYDASSATLYLTESDDDDFYVGTNATLDNSGAISTANGVNYGTITGDTNGSLTITGDFTNKSGATVEKHDITLSGANSVFKQQGTLDMTGQTLTAAGGTFDMINGTAGQTQNLGTLDLSSGNLLWNLEVSLKDTPVADMLAANSITTGTGSVIISTIKFLTDPTDFDDLPIDVLVANTDFKDITALSTNPVIEYATSLIGSYLVEYNSKEDGGYLTVSLNNLYSALKNTAVSRQYNMSADENTPEGGYGEMGGTNATFTIVGNGHTINGLYDSTKQRGMVVSEGNTLNVNNAPMEGFTTALENEGSMNLTDMSFTGNDTDIENNGELAFYGNNSLTKITGTDGNITIGNADGSTTGTLTVADGGSIADTALTVNTGSTLDYDGDLTVTGGENAGTITGDTGGELNFTGDFENKAGATIENKDIKLTSGTFKSAADTLDIASQNLTFAGGTLDAENNTSEDYAAASISGDGNAEIDIDLTAGTSDTFTSTDTTTSGTITLTGVNVLNVPPILDPEFALQIVHGGSNLKLALSSAVETYFAENDYITKHIDAHQKDDTVTITADMNWDDLFYHHIN